MSDMQHIWFYAVLVCLFLFTLLINSINERKYGRFNKYQNCLCLIVLANGFLLWPFMNHPFLFSTVFWGIFHNCWDQDAVNWFNENFELVDLDEWLGSPKIINKKMPRQFFAGSRER